MVYVLASRGEAGIDGTAPAEAGPLREREQVEAARLVGVPQVEFLDHPDGVIEYGVPLRRDLAAAIRRHRPELVVTLNHAESWPGGHRNSPDHRNTGLASSTRSATRPTAGSSATSTCPRGTGSAGAAD